MPEDEPTNAEQARADDRQLSPRRAARLGRDELGLPRRPRRDAATRSRSRSCRASLAKNPTLLQRFLREAKSAEALEHPNIVAIYDRGVDQGRHYLVLEFVEGGDLHDRVRNDGPLRVAEAVAVDPAVAEGLKYRRRAGA